VQAPFPSDAVGVHAGGQTLDLDWKSARRREGVSPPG
jgi:hypothetical protein